MAIHDVKRKGRSMCDLMYLLLSIDVNDLQNFVNVALATAAGGEDDYAHDKLSDLRTVGSGVVLVLVSIRVVTSLTE